jgi:hypothetical protein
LTRSFDGIRWFHRRPKNGLIDGGAEGGDGTTSDVCRSGGLGGVGGGGGNRTNTLFVGEKEMVIKR